MKIRFNPPLCSADAEEATSISVLPWYHPRVEAALHELFGDRDGEELICVDVNKHGMWAYFEPRYTPAGGD